MFEQLTKYLRPTAIALLLAILVPLMLGRVIIFLRPVLLLAALLILAVLYFRRSGAGTRTHSGEAGAWLRDALRYWRHRHDERSEYIRNASALRGKTALVIDPDTKSQRVMSWKLERLGCSVLTARNGTQAQSILRDNAIEVIFVDTLLPDVSAADFHRSLPDPGTPVVFLGVMRNQWDELRSLGGATACLSKPYDPDEAAALAGSLLIRRSELY